MVYSTNYTYSNDMETGTSLNPFLCVLFLKYINYSLDSIQSRSLNTLKKLKMFFKF